MWFKLADMYLAKFGLLLTETKRKGISRCLAFKVQSIPAYVVNRTVSLQLVMNVLQWLVLLLDTYSVSKCCLSTYLNIVGR